MTWRLDFVVRKGVALLVPAVIACTESSAPGAELKPVELVLSPMSPTAITATVGSSISDLPTVATRDAKGKPVSGVVVNFQVIGADHLSNVVTQTSNENGITQLPQWRVANVPGINVVTASIGSGMTVEFRATGKAGPPAFIVKLNGDAQIITAGDELPISPEVRITDAFNNPVPSVFVSFSVVSGESKLISPDVMTDAAGIARAGTWKLLARGDHSLAAQTPGVAPVLFTASAFRRDLPVCTIRDNLEEGHNSQSVLDASSCIRDETVAYAVLSLSRLQQAEYVFRVNSVDFDTNLELVDTLGRVIASNNNAAGGTTDSEIRALVPPGGATLVVSAARAGGKGKYVVSYQKATDPNGCKEVFVTRGVATVREIREWCDVAANDAFHTYKIYLKPGEKVTLVVEDLAYEDWAVGFSDPRGSPFQPANTTPRSYYYTFNFVASLDGYYTIVVGAYPISGYNLTIK